jgi:hypothetical protein
MLGAIAATGAAAETRAQDPSLPKSGTLEAMEKSEFPKDIGPMFSGGQGSQKVVGRRIPRADTCDIYRFCSTTFRRETRPLALIGRGLNFHYLPRPGDISKLARHVRF